LFPLVRRPVHCAAKAHQFLCEVEAAGVLVKLDLAEDSDGPWAGFAGVATPTSPGVVELQLDASAQPSRLSATFIAARTRLLESARSPVCLVCSKPT
jgi:hypothetical protein